MQTLGQRLRAEREKRGLTIPELADRTRIRSHYFESIEADKPEEFPGRFFYRSFLRQYADLLELPESEVHSEIERSLLEEQSEKAEADARMQGLKPEVRPMPTGRRVNMGEETRRWAIRLSGLLAVLVLCSLVYFFWQRWGQRYFDETWRSVATRPAKPAPSYPQSARGTAPAAQNTPTPSANPDGTPGAAGQQPPAAGQPEVKVDSPPPGVPVQGKIEVRASDYCWIGGWRDGKMFVSYTLQPGETRIVEGGGALRLQFGNSGGVAITVDGKTLQPIGAKGERRTLEYQNGAYHLLNRVPPATPKPPAEPKPNPATAPPADSKQ
jgi:cytoskeleton protein RodZ